MIELYFIGAVVWHVGLLWLGLSLGRSIMSAMSIIPAMYIAMSLSEWLVWLYVGIMACWLCAYTLFGYGSKRNAG